VPLRWHVRAEGGRIHSLRHRGVDLTVGDVGSVAAFQHLERGAAIGRLDPGQHPLGGGLSAARSLRRREQFHRAGQVDGKQIIGRFERPIVVAVLHVRSEAAEAGDDRLSRLGVEAKLPRQLQQAERLLQRDGRLGHRRQER
jgi:hypothetical protein